MIDAAPEPCGLCRGRRTVTLAFSKPLATGAFQIGRIPSSPAIEQRTYPCPECSTPQNKIGLIGVAINATADTYGHVAHNEIFERKAADLIFEFIRKERLITFRWMGITRVVAELAVVSDSHEKLTEKYVGTRVQECVVRILSKAISDIRVWGSNYEGARGRIGKDKAVEFIHDAARDVLI